MESIKQTTVHCYTTQASDGLVLHVMSGAPLGIDTQAATTPDELRALVQSTGAASVNFYFCHMPRRVMPVPMVTDAVLARFFRGLVPKAPKARPVAPVASAVAPVAAQATADDFAELLEGN